MKKSFIYSAAALTALGLSSMAHAARGGTEHCAPQPPATCYPDDCKRCYCLGPENYGVNAPVCPKTCNGDWEITVAGFYWNAHQDGMEYAIRNNVSFPEPNAAITPPAVDSDILALNNLVDAEYQNPNFKWDFGFKVGLGYCTTCDGWDIGVEWTWYRGKASEHIEAESSDNQTLMPLWSAFAPAVGGPLFASDMQANWKLELNLIDIELGRNFWTSKYLAIRPFMGLRIAFIDQTFGIDTKGGSYSSPNQVTTLTQASVNNNVSISNDYQGVGIRGGLDSTWNLGCGWAIYGNMAGSIVYGKFKIDQDETNREAVSPHTKSKVAEIKDDFRASRAMLDLGLGLQWMGMFCECQYGIRVALGWEHHMFFDQNQMWRINRIGDGSASELPNNLGENVYQQRRGDLDTQGWTLTVDFSF